MLLTACGTQAGAPGRPCTEIAALVGINVRITPSVAGRFADTTSLEACWNGSCHTYPFVLSPATTAADSTCAGTGPDDTCSAQVRETGGKTGFAVIPELPAAPVRVTFAGETLTVTPKAVYPNGPDCGTGGPQVELTVDENGVR
ncbi:hypothetical protein Atai01_74880 [Amycolatopsis taiwanensis]|uniref:Uncharacterized protein n=1 Tax=Amycolatopsis taiwanensis TaxID=342230 RepID=A0A9W6VKQ8_9PSEU|nr:hypothetical protein Atai01_74880 [Amycolatopsis taiwanensis]